MLLSFRAKLLLISGATALALTLLIGVDLNVERTHAEQINGLQRQYLPKLEIGPQLRVEFERLVRAIQDAVAAQDHEALDATRGLETTLLSRIDASEALEPPARGVLRLALERYYGSAYEVSRRLLAGEVGEEMVAAMRDMQARHQGASQALDATTRIDRAELAATFASLDAMQAAAARLRAMITGGALAAVLLLSLWAARRMLSSIAALSAGLVRVTEGELDTAVRVSGDDEIGHVAALANRMTARLRALAQEQARRDWSKNGEVGLAAALQGELEPEAVAARTTGFLVRHLEALGGACYLADDDGALRLAAQQALDDRVDLAPAPHFQAGEGLVGDAARADALRVIDNPSEGRFRLRGGLVDVVPRSLVQVPMLHLGKTIAVVELLLLGPTTAAQQEFLATVRSMIAVSLEVARQRRARAVLLAETQRQATALAAQEEELRAANEELQSQQEELRHSNDELLAQTQALEAARESLARKAQELATVSAYKSQFLANMSHELRTPLNSMLLLSSLLAENDAGNLSAKQVEHARIIHDAGQDLLALINQVLDLARIESGRQEINREPVTVRELIAHLERTYAPLARDKGLGFEAHVANEVPVSLYTDRRRVEQILTNFLGNAIKFTERGGVSLSVGPPPPGLRARGGMPVPGDFLAFAVSDTGMGIATEHQERIFSPFEQLATTSAHARGGTGLGLAIAAELAHALGGALGLTSTPAAGSTFYLYLPTTPVHTAATSSKRKDPTPPATKTTNVPGATSAIATVAPSDDLLLVIEDDQTFADVVCEVAATRRLRTVVAASGEAGLEAARAERPTGIVLDLRLPDVDGMTILRRLRADPLTSRIPVHIISALDAREEGLALGAVGYVTKPATRDEILRVVDTLVPLNAGERRVLIVEDDEKLGTSLVALLDGQDIRATRTTSAAAALRAVAADRFAVLILDLGLPDMDGLELLEHLRQQPGAQALPVIVYTGRALSKAEVRRLEGYAEAVILKEGKSTERLLDELRLFLDRLSPDHATDRAVVAAPQPNALAGKVVLVVDDDMRAVYALSTLLRAKGMEVVVADHGRAAVELLAGGAPVDAVLMDIMMPEMDGYEAMKLIRADPQRRDLPIIAFTAKAMKDDRDKCLRAGASDYMAKPVDGDRLLMLLNAWLSPPPADGTA